MTLPSLSRSLNHRRGSTSLDDTASPSSPFHVIARVLLLATILAAPWAYGAVQPWAWGSLMVAALLILVLWAVGCVHRGVLRISWTPLYWPFLAFLLIAMVQLFAGWTADHVATREAVFKLVTNFVFFFLAGQLLFAQPENGRALKLWGLVVTLLAFALSVLALAQLMTTGQGMIYWSVPTVYGPFGPYVSANDYCGLMEMLIPVSAGYILSGSFPQMPRPLLWAALGVALATIAISGSRGGAMVMLLELLLFGFIIFRYRPRGAWRRVFPVMVGLILVSAGVFAWMSSASRNATHLLSIFQTDKSVQVKMGDRFWVAKDTLRMARSHPALGIGVGTFETVFPAYMTHMSNLHWTHAHDDFAEALAETGLPGGVLILCGLVIFFRRAFFHFPDRLRAEWGWIPIGAEVGAVGLLCHSLVDFNLRVPANAAWFVVCVAVATHAGSRPDRPTRVARVSVQERNEDFIN